MPSTLPTIFVIEDDLDVQSVLKWHLSSLGVSVRFFERPSEILVIKSPIGPSCLVMDFQLPEMNGLELLESLRAKGWLAPFIIASGFGDVPRAVDAMRLGAIDFLEKPIAPQKLLQAVTEALQRDSDRIQKLQETAKLAAKLERLTPRESEVLRLVVQGKLTKQIAMELGVTVKTIETHRSSIMKKLGISSVAVLVREVTQFGKARLADR